MKSLPEFIELSTKHVRKQFEAMTAQTKELTELAQKVTTEITVKDWRHGDSKGHPTKLPNLEAEGVVERLDTEVALCGFQFSRSSSPLQLF